MRIHDILTAARRMGQAEAAPEVDRLRADRDRWISEACTLSGELAAERRARMLAERGSDLAAERTARERAEREVERLRAQLERAISARYKVAKVYEPAGAQ